MDTPLQLEIQGFEPSAHVRELIETGIRKVEERCGRITSCRVSIRSPGAHHRMGEPYAVTIYFALPNDGEVSVGPTTKAIDRRQADINFAINDAFRRAMRQLREQTRRLQGNVKQHIRTPATGS